MKFLWSIVVVLALAGLVQSAVENKCGTCMSSNEVLCLNQTSYQFCMNDKPLSRVYQCAEGLVCSNSNDICVDKDTTSYTDVCGPGTSSCGNCPVGTIYTCVSRTQFARCVGGAVVPSMVQSCDTDEVCLQSVLEATGKICAPTCVGDFLGGVCSNDVYETTTTTSAPPVTPSVNDLKSACTAGMGATSTTTYFYVPNPSDAKCTSYVYCETINNQMYAFVMSCKSGLFFNPETSKCQSTQPTSCIASTTSTTTPTSSDATTSSTNVAPSSSEATPSSTDAPSSSSEAASSTSEATPSSSEATPTTTNVAPSSSEGTPSSTDAASSSSETATSSTDVASSSTEATPSSTDAASSSSEAASSSTNAASSTSEATSSSTDTASASSEATPSSTDAASSSSDTSPQTSPSSF